METAILCWKLKVRARIRQVSRVQVCCQRQVLICVRIILCEERNDANGLSVRQFRQLKQFRHDWRGFMLEMVRTLTVYMSVAEACAKGSRGARARLSMLVAKRQATRGLCYTFCGTNGADDARAPRTVLRAHGSSS